MTSSGDQPKIRSAAGFQSLTMSVRADFGDRDRRALDHRTKPLFPCANLLLAPLALGDVEAADQEQRPVVDLRQGDARPGDREPSALARDPVVVVLADAPLHRSRAR